MHLKKVQLLEYCSAIKKNEILPFATTLMDLEGIILIEISQTERQILYDITYKLNQKKQQSNEYNKIEADPQI